MSLLLLLRPKDGNAIPVDPFPITLTIQEHGHTATVDGGGHTATLDETDHRATVQENR